MLRVPSSHWGRGSAKQEREQDTAYNGRKATQIRDLEGSNYVGYLSIEYSSITDFHGSRASNASSDMLWTLETGFYLRRAKIFHLQIELRRQSNALLTCNLSPSFSVPNLGRHWQEKFTLRLWTWSLEAHPTGCTQSAYRYSFISVMVESEVVLTSADPLEQCKW